MNMAEVDEGIETSATSLLPTNHTDKTEKAKDTETQDRHDEEVGERGKLNIPSRLRSNPDLSWIRRCYGSLRKLVGPRIGPRGWDVEAAVARGTDQAQGAMLKPTGLMRKISRRIQRNDKDKDMHPSETHDTAADYHPSSSTRHAPAALPIRSKTYPHLLSDGENERMNRKIDKLIAAIDNRRPIHFAPATQTGEVEIFADHEVTDQYEYDERERDVVASSENFGHMIRSDNSIRRLRRPYSLQYASSTDSWVSTDSERSSSNAWERAVAAANVRFALAHGGVNTVVRRPFRGSRMEKRESQGQHIVRNSSPIPLDFYKPVRPSTPSIHSNGSEQDTSSPLFKKSCERILRDTYTKFPDSTFQRESGNDSQRGDFATFSEPCDVPSPDVQEATTPSGAGRAFGVFQDDLRGESMAKKTGKLALRSKALKDISNLRRPGYLQFNSFAMEAKSVDDEASTSGPATVSSARFEGPSNAESRRAYIGKRWPELLDNRGDGSIVGLSRVDGAARRYNEQAIGSPINTSLYSLPHTSAPREDRLVETEPSRQAHFDLALARLEGRALPPPPLPIQRHPDSATLYDHDIDNETKHDDRPLPLYGPTPSSNPNANRWLSIWRYFR